MHAEEPAVGDRARVRDGEPPRARPAADHARGAVPDDPRPQLRELVRRIAAGEHVEHVLELLAREVGERVRAADEPVQLVDLDLVLGDDRHDLLRQDVERVARDLRLLDLAAAHRARDDGALEQVAAELREDAPLRDRAELVAGPADPLEAARDGLRALDLDHEVDGAHVDPELEARGRDEARDPPRLQVLLDDHPLLPRQRAVVRARAISSSASSFSRTASRSASRRLLTNTIVERCSRTSSSKRGVDRRPDRAGGRLVAGGHLDAVRHDRLREVAARAELAQVLDRHDDLEVELLPRARVDELDRAVSGDEAADLGERALRRGQADALHRPLEQRVEALQAEREVRAALRAGDGVHLVDDHASRRRAASRAPAT